MKGEILFQKMTDISDEYISDGALTSANRAGAKRSRFASLSRVLNSGWGVACICCIVAIAAVLGMMAWGRMGEMTGPGSDPDVRFAFSYEMTANDGSPWSGTALPGDVVNVDTTIVNHGKAFDTYDFFAYAQFVLQEDESVVIEGHYPLVDTDKHKVETGTTGSRTFHFHISENATPGVYDLVLSCDGVRQVYSGVLRVGNPTEETKSPENITDRTAFSFGYEPFGGHALVNSLIHLETWVVNEGASFVFEGSSGGFAPGAVLIHTDTQYRIEGQFDLPTDFIEVTVKTGDVGRKIQEFFIPADAPTGDYELELSYGGISKTFESVLTVAEPTTPDPGMDPAPAFTFSCRCLNQPTEYLYWRAGDTLMVEVGVTNNGTPFTMTGSSDSFIPYAELRLVVDKETIMTIPGMVPMTEDYVTFTVKTGQTGSAVYTFTLPDDLPGGKLSLHLSFEDASDDSMVVGHVSDFPYSEQEIIEMGARAIQEAFPNLDLSLYSTARVTDNTIYGKDSVRVFYQLTLFGCPVDDNAIVRVTINRDGSTTSPAAQDLHPYAAYYEYIHEEEFLAARDRIIQGVMDVDSSINSEEEFYRACSFYLDISRDNALCLMLEHIGPPLYDENGNSISGCGDHEHYFFSEELYQIP